MSKSKFSPGPWEVKQHDEGKELLIITEDGDIGAVWWSQTLQARPIDTANAHLIAAAPEMLAALQKVRSNLTLESAHFATFIDPIIARMEGSGEFSR